MKSLFLKIKKSDYRHCLCTILLIYSILCGILFIPSYKRLILSFKDFGLSIAFYFCVLLNIKHNIVPTVNIIDKSAVSLLPFNFEEFKVGFFQFWNLFFKKENFFNYFISLNKTLNLIVKLSILLIPVLLALYYLLQNYLKRQNNDYNIDSKPLKIYKKVIEYTLNPVLNWFKSLINFLKVNNTYIKIFLIIWALNLNLMTILIEFLSFYFYFTTSFDFKNIYKQIVKLFLDLNVIFEFIPLWGWVIFCYFILDNYRKKVGYSRLNHQEMKDRGFVNSTSICNMLVGTMGKKKTTILTDMALSQEVMFRDKALELILENNLKFPNFPWINFENELKKAINNRIIYNLATTEVYIAKKKKIFETIHNDLNSYMKWLHYCDLTGYEYQDACFGYDFQKYGLFFDDKLKVNYLFDVLKSYAKLYFIYVVQSSLLITNYSVRVDNLLSDLGNFPMWNTDFFKKDSKLIDSFSRHSHIIDFDALRLGKKLIEENSNNIEFGILCICEIGKERGNKNDYEGIKKKDVTANQKNDLLNMWLKLSRHVLCTIDNFTFIKVLTDDQRPESLGADARDLCQILHIVDFSDTYLTMPYFFIEELLYSFIFSKFLNLYKEYRYLRSDNTLLMYLIKSISAKFINYYKRMYNIFSAVEMALQLENGTLDGKFIENKYYLMPKKIYSKRFSTDCFSDIFREKSLKSKMGIKDLDEYQTEKASFEELQKQNSYFVIDLLNLKENGNLSKDKED